MPFHSLGFHTFPRVMTSCSDAVSAVIWQWPGISSGGLWERNKPFNYSSEGLFENTLALFPSMCAVCLSLLYADLRVQSCNVLLFDLLCKCGHRWWQSRGVAGSISSPRFASPGSRLEMTAPGTASRRMVWVYPICSRAEFIGLIYAAAGSCSEWPAWLSTEARDKTLRWKSSFHRFM